MPTVPHEGIRTRVYAVAVEEAAQQLRETRPSGRRRQRDDNDTRSEGQRDRDRIIYSHAWRRLGGVTQVVTPFSELPLLHNRLTHSEKVAQVARSIGERLLSSDDNWDAMSKLGGFDIDVCEAAGLAHDLGHPPFGHIGEEVLDAVGREVLKLPDGFEGNAQSLRILTIGKTRSNLHEGLDLTYATLAAVSKYPWKRVGTLAQHDSEIMTNSFYRRHWKKFNAYNSEYDLLVKAREFVQGRIGQEIQTLEASVMDVADDITYAVHDLEDFYLAGILDVSLILEDLSSYQDGSFRSLEDRLAKDYPGWFDAEALADAAHFVKGHLESGFVLCGDRAAEKDAVAKRECSRLIEEFIDSIHLQSGSTLWENGPYIGLRNKSWHNVQVLKEITKKYVIHRPDFALLQHGQQQVLEKFVEMLFDWSKRDRGRLPPRLRHELKIAEDLTGPAETGYGKIDAPRGDPNRAILDYICSLSDLECLQIYYNLSGVQVHRPGMTIF